MTSDTGVSSECVAVSEREETGLVDSGIDLGRLGKVCDFSPLQGWRAELFQVAEVHDSRHPRQIW